MTLHRIARTAGGGAKGRAISLRRTTMNRSARASRALRAVVLAVACIAGGLATLPAAAQDTPVKVLRIGGDPDFRPISFADPSGKLIGFDVDLATELAAHMKVPLDYQGVAWDGIIPALQASKIDAITQMAITDQRRQVVAFSQPYLAQTMVTVVRANQPDLNPGPADLGHYKVGVMVNTSAATLLSKMPDVHPVTYNTVTDEYNDLLLGRIDVVAIEGTNGTYVASTPQYAGKLRATDTPLSSEKHYVGAALRKDDTALLAAINTAIDQMRADGSLARIMTKWFGDARMLATK
jgi:ABC-type amino acid transport substrate-binding protein